MLVELNGFNTQPPEGGWARDGQRETKTDCFNTQPPEGGWIRRGAGGGADDVDCFNTQPPEGGWLVSAN